MPDPTLHIYFREPTVDTNSPITEGKVKVQGFEVQIVPTEDQADAWDCGFGALMRSKAEGLPYISIPAFPNRKFRMSYMFVNAAAGIDSPKDLEGKRVGIPVWDNTANVWARGALQHYYGVDLARVKWMAANPRGPLPPGVQVQALPAGGGNGFLGALDACLVSGDLDAVIAPDVLPSITRKDPKVRRLFPDFKKEEQAYFRNTGIFPISHVVTFKQEFVDRFPDAPAALLTAFRQSRDIAFHNIEGDNPQVLVLSWASAAMEEQKALMGEHYWAYNVEDNRHSLEAMTQFAHEQALAPFKVDVDSLFVPAAAALPGK